jgi:hypothetical protein
MECKEYRKLLNDLLLKQLDNSFKVEKTKERLVRKREIGSNVIYVALWNHSPDFVFSLTPAITIDPIETLFRDVFSVVSKDTHTLMTQLWRFDRLDKPHDYLPWTNAGSPYFWAFHSEATLRQGVECCLGYLEKCLLLFDKVTSVADAHRALNIEKWDTTSTYRSHGLVAAFLAREDWSRIGASYQLELCDWTQSDQDAYAKAIARLTDYERSTIAYSDTHTE